MTVAEMALRIRQVYNETTAGFLADTTDIFDAMDSAQNQAIQLLLGKQRMMRMNIKDYIHPSLTPLRALDASNTTTIGAGLQEYNLPSDFLEFYYAEYSTTNGGTKYPCAYMDFALAAKKNSLGYIGLKSPIAYIGAEKLGFYPQPSAAGAGNYAHYYFKQPSAVADGTPDTEITLREETHEGIFNIAISDLYAKDKQYELSAGALKKGIELITKL